MIELLMVVCSAASPYNCKDEKLGPYMEQGLTVMACVMKGQLRIAEWSRHNPGWTVARYKCGKANQFAKI